jgi:hypothetical protein
VSSLPTDEADARGLALRHLLGVATLVLPFVLLAGECAAQQIEIQIRGPGPADDYVTWAPAPARIRQVPGPQAADRHIVLTNDPEAALPPGMPHPRDGNFAFAMSVARGQTATADSLDIVLPKDGSWVDFTIAGSFPRASSEGKDAIIVVHDGAADGALLGQHAAMVRIRKDHRTLTDGERRRFLQALATLHNQPNGYERFVKIHEQTSLGHHDEMSPPYPWPDIAHQVGGWTPSQAYLKKISWERML